MSINGFKMRRLFVVETKSTTSVTINVKVFQLYESINGNKGRVFMILYLFRAYAL